MDCSMIDFFENASSLGFPKLKKLMKDGLVLSDPLTLEDGRRPLHFAAKKGNVEMVEKLLNQKNQQVYVDVPDYYGNTAMHYASKEGHLGVVQLLIREGADPNMENNKGCTVLITAVCHERLEVTRYLLSKGANVNANTRFDNHLVRTFKKAISERESALSCAIRLGNKSIINELLQAGATVDEQFSSPIHSAVKKGDLELIMILLEHKVNLDGRDIQGLSPLNAAIALGKYDIVEVLLDMGVRRDCSVGEKSLLFVAFQNGQTEIAKLLYKKGVYITVDEMESTFEFVIGSNSDINSYGANCNARESMKGSVIHKAIIEGNIEMVQLLVERGIDVSTKTCSGGQTPLILATQRHLVPLVKLLLTNGGDNLNVRDDRGKTPMYYSTIGYGSVEICKLFLDVGLSINNIVCTETNMTALHSAVGSNNRELIELLLLRGADVSARYSRGNTPFHLLLEHGNKVNDDDLIYLVKTFIQKLEDPICANFQNETLLDIAINKCSTGVIKSILEERFEIDRDDLRFVKNLLTKMIEHNHESLVNIVLSKVAELHFADVKLSCAFKDMEKDGELLEDHVGGSLELVHEVNLSNIVLHQENINKMVIEGFTPLQIAMYKCNFQLAEYLIGKGAIVNVRDLYDLLPIHLAIIHHNFALVEQLCSKMSKNDCSSFGIPLLHLATYYKNIEMVELMMKQDSWIHSKDEHGNTALQIAVKAQNKELVDLLSTKSVGIDKDSQNKFGNTAFYIALNSSNSQIALSLIEHGVDINTINRENSSSLHQAASNHLTFVMRKMFWRGVKDINLKDFHGFTPLDRLVENFQSQKGISCENATDSVIMFLKLGASVHSVFWALVENNQVNMKRVILECKHILSPEIETLYNNKTFTRNEVYRKVPLYLVEFFWSQGLTCSNWIIDLERYLSDAINENNITAIKQLLDIEVDLDDYNILKNKTFQELFFLKEGRKYGLGQIFLDRGVNVNFFSRGFVPLVKVAQNGDCSMVNILLDKGANINSTYHDNRTALYCAVISRNRRLVQILLERGAATYMPDDLGRLELDRVLNA